MKSQDIQRAVEEVVLNVFENMYFMFPEVIGEGDPVPSFPESCFKARVSIQNSSEILVLYGSEKPVVGMANNLLGTDQPIGEVDLVDVFKEAANVVAGNLLTTLALDDGVGYNVPVAERLDTCSELSTVAGTIFNVDDEFFKVAVVSSNSHSL